MTDVSRRHRNRTRDWAQAAVPKSGPGSLELPINECPTGNLFPPVMLPTGNAGAIAMNSTMQMDYPIDVTCSGVTLKITRTSPGCR